jgi:dTDP-4-dehydrorhamnose 3,5-epimerase
MIFRETELVGVVVIEPERLEDERGFFARTFCQREFKAHGLNSRVAQCNLSFNHRKGTLRGMHYQLEPHREVKLVRCTRGAIFDVIVDLRPESPSYCRWVGVELSEENRRMLYVPEGFAHGYQTLVDNSEVVYQVSEFYAPGSERGVRFDDPTFGIAWPCEVTVISEKDSQHPRYKP